MEQLWSTPEAAKPETSYLSHHLFKKPNTLVQQIEKATHWIDNYPDSHTPDKQKLIEWISKDNGDGIEYKQFCEIAQALEKLGYKTQPPPSEEEFLHAKKEYQIHLLSNRPNFE